MPGQIAKLGNSAAQFLLGGLAALRSLGNAAKDEPAAGEGRRQDNADLRDAVKQWRQVFEHNPVMYFMVDPAGTVLNVNPFGAAQLGYTAAELTGQSVLNVFFEEDRDFVRRCVGHGEGRMLVTVTDRGVGLGNGATERIFTPFFTTKPSGLGMGLSICRSIIEAHAGRLSAFPNDGSGATFQIALPLPTEDTS
ncbi:ATP-binding protein [Bradyrhizobium sp. S3.2.6]|uniref:ATP-binding protein n=1 Tax=Bradyrhizobium sp. S3.2.6 TaxID=3156428 RepID=UPI003396D38F